MKAGLNSYNMGMRSVLRVKQEQPKDLYKIGLTDVDLALEQLEWEIRDRLNYAEEIIDGGPVIDVREKDEAYGRRDAFSRILDRGKFLGLFGNKK